jgi:DNA repair photolyase
MSAKYDFINLRGRGAPINPDGRFERLSTEAHYLEEVADPDDLMEERQVETTIIPDKSKTIISTNDSPDVGMMATVNPYRGCEHGCIYCYARPTHEYFGMSAGIDFETKIFAKFDAPALLRRKLQSPRWQPEVISFSGVTDAYQPVERKLKITRACLEVLAEFRNPVAIITKNNLVTRDIDLLGELAAYDAAGVYLSITSLDATLARRMEPRASAPAMRLKAVETLAKAGIPVGISIGPVLPGLTDHEIPAILKSAANAGASRAHYTMMRLPYGVKDLFQEWLKKHYPDKAEKVLNRVRAVRDQKLNDANFGTRMVGTGLYAEQIADMMQLYKRKYGLDKRGLGLSTAAFTRSGNARQGSLF